MSSQEDRNCRADRKPWYTVAEAAVRWCNIRGRTIGVDDKGIPLDDPQNPCLRIRAQEIMFAIDEGILCCGREGKTVAEHVAPARRTIRHIDLKEWMVKHFPGEKPAFLFDDVERQTHSAINVDTYRALKAAHDASVKRFEEAQETILTLNTRIAEMTFERDALRKQIENARGMGTRQKRTWLVVMAALCEMANVSPYSLDGLPVKISEATQRLGATVSDDTIRKIITEIPGAIESRS